MRSSKTLIALSLLAVAALTATPALAQTCGGLASYSSAPWRSGANGVFSGDMTALTADISYGTNNFFGGLGLGLNNYDGMDGSGVALGLAGGYELTAGQKKNIHICPGVQLAHVFGPNDINSSGSNFSQTNITLGGAVGVVATRAGQWDIIPTGGLGFVIASSSLSNELTGDLSNTDTYLQLNFGSGFVYNNLWSLRAGLGFPIGSAGGDVSFGLAAGYSFGQAR